jgi:UDP-GlcNAc:undecaprenyl-phosphate GlcNAc-1-phosphate transferase
LLVVALVPAFRRLAVRRGITDNPASGKVHRLPTPYLGGVAIALGAIAASFLLPDWQAEAALIFAAATLVALVGLLDDMRKLRPSVRIGVECIAATAAVVAGAQFDLFGGVPDLALSVIWLVLITNAFNLLDNMDAAAGTIATTIATALAVCALLNDQVLVGGLAVVVASACLAFLIYNWHPARIFMGDAGSLFLGFLLTVIALKLRPDVSNLQGSVAVILILGAAVFDTTLVVISRTLKGRSILIGGTDHTSHRLTLLGFRPQAVTAIMFVSTAYFCVIGVLLAQGMISAVAAILCSVLPAVVALGGLLWMGVYVDDGNLERTELVRRSSLPSPSEGAVPSRPRSVDGQPPRHRWTRQTRDRSAS